MNSKEIFEEYTQASNKVKYIKEKAKTLGVYDSDVICELFKSGYKFEELKRANKATYNAGMKKYEKWKENGSPADEDAPEAEEEKPVYDYPADDSGEPETAYDSEDAIAHLENLLKKSEERMSELISTNQYLEDNNKIYMDENCQLKAELCQLKAEKAEDSEVMNEHIKANKRMMDRIDELQLSVNELTEKNEQLEHEKCRLEADTRKYQIKVHELAEQLELEKADSESDSRTLKEARNECDELRSKLQKAERYILNRIYDM